MNQHMMREENTACIKRNITKPLRRRKPYTRG